MLMEFLSISSNAILILKRLWIQVHKIEQWHQLKWMQTLREHIQSLSFNSNKQSSKVIESMRNYQLLIWSILLVLRRSPKLMCQERTSRKLRTSICHWQLSERSFRLSLKRKWEKIRDKLFLTEKVVWLKSYVMHSVATRRLLWFVLFLLRIITGKKHFRHCVMLIRPRKLRIKQLWMKVRLISSFENSQKKMRNSRISCPSSKNSLVWICLTWIWRKSKVLTLLSSIFRRSKIKRKKWKPINTCLKIRQRQKNRESKKTSKWRKKKPRIKLTWISHIYAMCMKILNCIIKYNTVWQMLLLLEVNTRSQNQTLL